MHIAVYLGSSLGKDSTIQEATKALGTWIGKEGHTLVYGGGQTGLMGIVADACLAEKGKSDWGYSYFFRKERDYAS